MTTAQARNNLKLLDWKELHDKGKMTSAFRKSAWVVHIPQSLPTWYAGVLGNLTGKYTPQEPISIDYVRDALYQGLKKETFERLKLAADVTSEELGRAIHIPQRTLARREIFKPDESERILRLASCFQKTLDVLGDLEKARRWFSSPKRALGGKTPLEFCDTAPGAQEVEHLLGRIEHGVFS